jgi:hypothetical protein
MKLFTRPYKMNDKENQIFSIVVKMANHQDTLILMDPLREVYYMDNKRMNYFVMVTSDIIKITNHKFYYTNQINLKFSDILVEKIKLAISRDRKKVEEEMFKNELNLLTDIDSNMDTNRPRHEEIIEPEKTASNKISDVMEAIFSI